MRKAWIVIVLVGLLGCGKTERPSPVVELEMRQVPVEMRELVPGGAHALLYLESARRARMLASRTWSGGLGIDPLSLLAREAGFDPKLVERGKPIAIAFQLRPGSFRPELTFILPAEDPAALASAHKAGVSQVRGGYVGLAMSDEYQPGGSRLGEEVPRGTIALRIDLARVSKEYGRDLEQLVRLAAAGAGDEIPVPLVMSAFASLRSVLDSADWLDLVGEVDAGEARIDLAYHAQGGSRLAKAKEYANLRDLVERVPPDLALVALYSFDLAELAEEMGGMGVGLVAFLKPDAPEFRAAIDACVQIAKHMGPEWMVGFDPDIDHGLGFVGAVRCSGAEKRLDTLYQTVRAQVGEGWEIGAREIDGATVYTVAFADGDGIELPVGSLPVFDSAYETAGQDDFIAFRLGTDERRMNSVLKKHKPTKSLRRLMRRAGPKPWFLVHADLRRLAHGITGLMRKWGQFAPNIPGGRPAEVTLFGARDGRTYRFGLTVDLEQIPGLILDFKTR